MGNSPFLIPELEYRQRDTTSGVSEIIGIAVKAHEVRTSIVFGVNGKSVRMRSLHEGQCNMAEIRAMRELKKPARARKERGDRAEEFRCATPVAKARPAKVRR